MSKIIDSVWYTPVARAVGLPLNIRSVTGCRISIGVVLVLDEQKKFRSYIGYASGVDKKMDEEYIAQNGAKLEWAAAAGHFPKTYNRGLTQAIYKDNYAR